MTTKPKTAETLCEELSIIGERHRAAVDTAIAAEKTLKATLGTSASRMAKALAQVDFDTAVEHQITIRREYDALVEQIDRLGGALRRSRAEAAGMESRLEERSRQLVGARTT